MVDNVRRLTPDEVDDLIAGLPPAAGPRARMAIGALRLLSALPGDKAVELLLSRTWDQGVRDRVAAELRRLAGT